MDFYYQEEMTGNISVDMDNSKNYKFLGDCMHLLNFISMKIYQKKAIKVLLGMIVVNTGFQFIFTFIDVLSKITLSNFVHKGEFFFYDLFV